MAAPRRSGPAQLLSALVAGGCLCCGVRAEGGGRLCAGCALKLEASRPLRGGPPAGIDRVASAAEHTGAARELVGALKFRRRLGAAEVMASRLAPLLDASEGCILVPAPTAPWRGRRRGFNPAAELARELARVTGLGVVDCLRRRGEGRQVGKGRGSRRAPTFEIAATAPVPPDCLLVDDVMTTGGTLTACAVALRRAGARRVDAATFTRRL